MHARAAASTMPPSALPFDRGAYSASGRADGRGERVKVVSGDVLDADNQRAEEAVGSEEAAPWWNTIGTTPRLAPRRPSWRQRLRNLTSAIVPFSLRERVVPGGGTWRARALLLTSLAALVALSVIASVFAFGFAARLARGASSQLPQGANTAAPPSGVVIQPLTGAGTPTPTLPLNSIGAWVSDSAPTTGSVQVFVRVTQLVPATQGHRPVAGVPVTLSVFSPRYNTTAGPVRTDAYGVATFTLAYGTGYTGYQPVFVTAYATTNGQTLSAQTSFAPH
ncbi:MAG: hypothetical protein IVW57_10660 [Ktedonobacterales bacterium]|nr:hypothetical protein [Ktedonobacterales bacterium]